MDEENQVSDPYREFGAYKTVPQSPPQNDYERYLNGGDPIPSSEYSPDAKTLTGAVTKTTTADAYYKYYGDRWNATEGQIRRANAMWEVVNGRAKYEDVDAQMAASADDILRDRRVAQFQKDHELDPATLADEAFATLPFIREVALTALGAGAAGAATGATYAAVAGQLGPQVALPEEALTIPAGAIAGWGLGSQSGMFAKSAQLAMAMHYDASRKSGVPHDIAMQGALASGTVQGLLEATQWHMLAGFGKKAMAAYLASGSGKTLVKTAVAQLIKLAGLSTGEGTVEAAQTLTEEAVRHLEQGASGVPTRPWSDVAGDMWASWKAGAKASLALGGAAGGVGFAASKVVPLTATALLKQASANSVIQDDPEIVDTRLSDIVTKQTTKVLEGRVSTSGMSLDDISYELTLAETQLKAFEKQLEIANKIIAGLRKAKQALTDEQNADHSRLVRAVSRTQDYISLLEHERALKEAAEMLSAKDLGDAQKARIEKSAEKMRAELDVKIAGVAKAQTAGRLEGLNNKILKLSAEISQNMQERVLDLQDKIAAKNSQMLSITDPASQALRDEIANELHTLEDQQRELEAFMDTGDSQLAPPGLKSKTKKLLMLAEERDYLQQLEDLLDNKLLNTEDLRELAVKIPTRSAKALVDKAVHLMGMAVKDEARAQKLSDTQKLQLLKSIVNTSQINAAHKKKLLDKVINQGLDRKFSKLVDELQDAIEKREEADKLQDARDFLEQTLEAIDAVDKRGAKDESRYTMEADEYLATYKEFIDDRGAAIKVLDEDHARLAAEAAAQDQGLSAPIDSTDPIRVAIAADVVDIKTKSAAELNALSAKLRNIMATGRAIKLEKIEARRLRRDARLQAAINLVQGTHPVDVRTGKVVKSTPGLARRAAHAANAVTVPIHTWDQVWELVFADSVSEERAIFDVHDTVQNEAAAINAGVQEAIDTITEGLDDELAAKVVSALQDPKIRERKVVVDYVDQEGDAARETLSLDAAMNWVAAMRCEQRNEGLRKGNLFTFRNPNLNSDKANNSQLHTAQEAMEDAVGYGTDKVNTAIIDGVVKVHDKRFERLNAAHVDEYGIPLGKIKNYPGTGPREVSRFEEGSYQERRAAFDQRASIIPGSTYEVTEGAAAYKEIGLTQNLWKQIQDEESWMAWREVEPDIRAVLSNKLLRDLITEKRGADVTQTIDLLFSMMSGTRSRQYAQQYQFLDQMRSKFAVAAQGFNPVTATKQLSGVLNFLQHPDVTPESTQKSVDEFFSDPNAAMDKLSATTYIRNRAGSLIAELHARLGKGAQASAWDQRAMWMITQSDRLANVTGGYVVYASVRDKALAGGASEIAAERAGLAAFERVGNRIQSSGTSDQKVALEFNSLGRMLTLFRKQPFQVFGMELNTWRRLIANPTNRANQIAVAKTFVVNRAAQVMFSSIGGTAALAFAAGFGGADEAKKEAARQLLKIQRDMLSTGLSAYPLLGDASTTLIFAILQKRFLAKPLGLGEKDVYIGSPSLPIIDQLNSIPVLFDLALQASTQDQITDGEFWKGIANLGTAIGGAGGAVIKTGGFVGKKVLPPVIVNKQEKKGRKVKDEFDLSDEFAPTKNSGEFDLSQ